jgi:hypothetical protein
MPKILIGSAWLLCASCAFAQFDSYTVTVTASRPLIAQADEVEFDVYVDAPLTASLSDVVAAVRSGRITASNLFSAYTVPVQSPSENDPVFEWAFTLAVPFQTLSQTIGEFTSLQQAIEKQGSGLTLSFEVNGTEVSTASQTASACPIAQLNADARGQAQRLASAAGMSLGNVLALSDGNFPGPVGTSMVLAQDRIEFTTANQLRGFIQDCYLVVKFQLIP